MRHLKLCALVAALSSLMAGPVFANDTYCQTGGFLTVHDGSDDTVNWTVTTNKARRVQNQLQTTPSRGCAFNFQSLGGIKSSEIIKKPTLGKAHFFRAYSLIYESDRPGTDEMAYRINYVRWSSNKLESAIIRFKIQVIDHPI